MSLSIQKDQAWFAILFASIYLIWTSVFVGLKNDHVIFAFLISIGSLLHRNIFKFYLGFAAFIIFWIIYDSLQVYPNYAVNSISTQELYDIEKSMFAFEYKGATIIPNEYFLDNQIPYMSFFLGLAYLMWMPAPFIFSGRLFFKNRPLLLRYNFCFLFVNILGFIGYYSYPAAPPWYFLRYGTEININMTGDAGLLINFDKLIGLPIFDSIYSRGTNVFAAVPSLHCAFTVINLYYAIIWKDKPSIIAFVFLAIGTWIGAVYSQHHYIVDVLLGILTAGIGLVLYETFNFKQLFRPLVNRILLIIN